MVVYIMLSYLVIRIKTLLIRNAGLSGQAVLGFLCGTSVMLCKVSRLWNCEIRVDDLGQVTEPLYPSLSLLVPRRKEYSCVRLK